MIKLLYYKTMQQDLQNFNFNQNIIRISNIDNQLYFIAKDVCLAIGLTDISKALDRVDEDEKLTRKFFVSGQNRDVRLVNESGLYSLILGSNKLEAKQFKKWVTSEVLPQIRKTGSYITSTQPQLPANYIEALKALVIAEEEKQVLLLENTQKQELLEKQAPQIEKYNQLHNAEGEFSLQEGMKSLHLKPNKAIDKLRELNYIFSTKQYTNYAYQKYIDNGLFVIKTHTLTNNKTKPQTYITAKGLAYFREILHKFNDCSVDKIEYKDNPYLTARQNANRRLALEQNK